MYGVEWLIGLALLGGLVGLGGGYLLGGRNDGSRHRELEAQLADARKELEGYRQEVVKQFSETARKFQTLNDSYTDLHEQLARSSSVLCGDITGPLLEAPTGHQDLIPAQVREQSNQADGDTVDDDTRGAGSAAAGTTPAAGAAAAGGAVDPYDDAGEIRVAEPTEALVAADQAAATEAPEADAAGDQQAPRSATGS